MKSIIKKILFSITLITGFLLIMIGGMSMSGCEDNRGINDGLTIVDSDSDSSNVNKDSDTTRDDSDTLAVPPGGMIVDPGVLNPSNNQCDNVLQVVIRDFSESHVDFERAHPGWGPATGMIEKVLGAGKKPVFANLQGEYQMIDYNCYTECINGGIAENAVLKETGDSYGDTPMWESAGSFAQWYEDVDGVNMHIEKAIVLAEQNDGSYLFDSSEFFPLGVDEGFGESPSGSGKNFLFTTEIHLQFPYEGGEVFTFRGDDDLWIFVNNRLAIDLGGLHWPFESTINFDSMAATLGIEPGKSYDMDIFHAERHTTESNFRIETNIGCFQNIQID